MQLNKYDRSLIDYTGVSAQDRKVFETALTALEGNEYSNNLLTDISNNGTTIGFGGQNEGAAANTFINPDGTSHIALGADTFDSVGLAAGNLGNEAWSSATIPELANETELPVETFINQNQEYGSFYGDQLFHDIATGDKNPEAKPDGGYLNDYYGGATPGEVITHPDGYGELPVGGEYDTGLDTAVQNGYVSEEFASDAQDQINAVLNDGGNRETAPTAAEQVQLRNEALGITPSPTASRAGTPSPTASRAGTPSPTASRAGTPSPTASRAGTPSPTASKAASPTPTAKK
jgi:hypothetical protein